MLGRRVEVSITKCVSYGHTAARSSVHRCELLTLPRLTAHGAHLRTDDLESNIRYLVHPSIKGGTNVLLWRLQQITSEPEPTLLHLSLPYFCSRMKLDKHSRW